MKTPPPSTEPLGPLIISRDHFVVDKWIQIPGLEKAGHAAPPAGDQANAWPAAALLLIDGVTNPVEALDWVRPGGDENPPAVLFIRAAGRADLDPEALRRGADEALPEETLLTPGGLAAALARVTGRRAAAAVSQQAGPSWQMVANAVPALMLVTGPDSRFLFGNQGWHVFHGGDSGDFTGFGWLDCIHRDDSPAFVEALSQAVSTGSTPRAEVRLRRRDGEYRWFQYTASLYEPPVDGGTGLIGSFIDITEMKKLESALAETKEEAVESVEMKAQFLANMTHEIRTPMNGILGMNALMLGTGLTPEQKELAEAVRGSGQTLLRMVDDILDFSRLEAKRLKIESIPLNPLAVMEESVELLAETARHKGLELICAIDPRMPPALRGDPGRLRQVLINLLGNAIKFTERGEVVLRASLAREDGNTARILFEVRDTGIGIPKHIQAKLFQAFVQGDGSTTRNYGGTGLGLAISKELVGLMKGTIEVESEPGRGSSFRLLIPLEMDPGAVGEILPAAADWIGKKVLLAEPNPTARQCLAEQIRVHGLECVEISGPKRAREMMAAEARNGVPFDLALLGMKGADETSVAWLKELAVSRWRGKTRLVALPRDPMHDTLQKLRQAGADDCLPKPVRPSRTRAVLVRQLKPAKPPPPAPSGDGGQTAPVLGGQPHFLLISDDPAHDSLSRQLAAMGATSTRLDSLEKAVTALSFFHHDGILLQWKPDAPPPPDVMRQFTAPKTTGHGKGVPVIALLDKNESATPPPPPPGIAGWLPLPSEDWDLAGLLGRCGFTLIQKDRIPTAAG